MSKLNCFNSPKVSPELSYVALIDRRRRRESSESDRGACIDSPLMTMASNEVLPPLIGAQLNHLVVHSQFPIKVDKLWSGSKRRNLLDRFAVLIPFCLDHIKWDVIYNVSAPLDAPDVIFGPDDDAFSLFLTEPDAFGRNRLAMSSLADWNYRESFRLLNLLLELMLVFVFTLAIFCYSVELWNGGVNVGLSNREQYAAYQKKCVGEVQDERIKFEISTISHREVAKLSVLNCL